MPVDILSQLQEVKPKFKKYMPKQVVVGFKAHLQSKGLNPEQLIDPFQIANANWTWKPKRGAATLSDPDNRRSAQKVMTLNHGHETYLTYLLNTALLGGKSYPILTSVLGTAGGIASFTGGLIFAAVTTTVYAKKTGQRILARMGDEIWQVEEIGKIREGTGFVPVHINSFWLVDPFRGQSTYNKGWLIHEERHDLSLD